MKGTESDIFFLQLMIRHHQGGAAMMQYAAEVIPLVAAADPIAMPWSDAVPPIQAIRGDVLESGRSQRDSQPCICPS